MKRITISTLFSFLTFAGYSQITKYNWLVGGSASFSSQKQNLNSSAVRGVNLKISPNIGYFFVDKVAGGTKLGLSYDKVKYFGGISKSTQLAIGPFLRYYILNLENRVNILTEATYQYITYSGNSGANSQSDLFTFSAGPVIYFNSSVGLECTISYELLNSTSGTSTAKTLYLNVGLQIHLEKD